MVHEHQQQSVKKSARQTREVVRRLGKLTEAQAAMGWGIVLLIITLVGAIYLNQTSKVAAVGRHAQQLQYELDEVQRENGQIERDIAEAQSMERLSEGTIRLGFVASQAGDIEYLVIPDYPDSSALPSLYAARAEKPAPAVETIADALQIVLQERLDVLMRGEFGD
jgi:cell division protein FtsL